MKFVRWFLSLKLWQKLVLLFVVTPLIVDTPFQIQSWRRERAAAKRRAQRQQRQQLRAPVAADPDDKIVLKAEHPKNLQDEKNLKGLPLWVSAGGQMQYYPYNGKSVDFSHRAGVLLGAEQILVRDAIEQAAPKSIETRFPDADAEVLLLFELPDDPLNANRVYAVAVGDREGHDYNLLTDQLFFYDDPHQVFSYWGPKAWKAIDQHTAVIGMTRRQLELSLGQVSTPRADIMGDVSIEYDNQGKPKLITFANGKATQIRDESQ